MSPAFGRLLPYVLRYKRQFILGLLCVTATTAMSLALPWVLKVAIDDLTRGVTQSGLAFYAFSLLAMAAVGAVFRYLMRRTLIAASRCIEYDVRNDFFERLQTLPLAYFQARRTGDLMSRATNDLGAVRMMIGPAVMYSTNTIITFIVAIALMLSIDWQLTLAALLPLPLVSIAVRYFGAAIHRRFERIQAQLSEMSAIVQEALAGVRVVRAYGQEAAEIAKFHRANHDYMERNRGLIRLQGVFHPSLSLLLGVGSVLLLWLGSRQVIRGQISLGEFVAFNSYLTMLAWPMIAFGWVTNMLQRGMASWKRMLEVIDEHPAIDDAAALGEGERPSAIRGAVEVRDLTFAYDGLVVLDRVSFSVSPGHTLAIIGATGSGKSTLVTLIPRLHDPPPGTVFVDGVDVRQWPLRMLRAAIGMAPQEPFLFSDTVGENVAFGSNGDGSLRAGDDPDGAALLTPLSESETVMSSVRQAAAVARLDKDLDDFPKGYQTMVGERGITLSGGQKQRTSIARALARDPRILILDDTLSAVDTHTEEEILAQLRRVMKERTSILISHRVSTVRDADMILVLERGRIIERGAHAQLVSLGGVYAGLHRKQLLEEELAGA